MEPAAIALACICILGIVFCMVLAPTVIVLSERHGMLKALFVLGIMFLFIGALISSTMLFSYRPANIAGAIVALVGVVHMICAIVSMRPRRKAPWGMIDKHGNIRVTGSDSVTGR